MTRPPPPAAASAKQTNSPRKSKDQPAVDYRAPGTATAQPPAWTPLPPMKPHRKLFVVLLLAWAVWCGVMIAMYFTTVRPHPQPTQPPPATERATA